MIFFQIRIFFQYRTLLIYRVLIIIHNYILIFVNDKNINIYHNEITIKPWIQIILIYHKYFPKI